MACLSQHASGMVDSLLYLNRERIQVCSDRLPGRVRVPIMLRLIGDSRQRLGQRATEPFDDGGGLVRGRMGEMKSRRRFQLSLRTLLLATTLIAVVLAFRVPQRLMAQYHAQMQSRYQAAWRNGWANGIETPQGAADRDRFWHHRTLAEKYRAAVQLSWSKWPDQASHSK
jgi:hypothetical protein